MRNKPPPQQPPQRGLHWPLGLLALCLTLLIGGAGALRSRHRFQYPAQREIEGRAFVQLALRPDAAAVAFNDAFHGGQPDA